VLTLPRRKKWYKRSATVAVRSGGCSGSGELVPANLFASKSKERAHELKRQKRIRKQSRARRATHGNSTATEGVSRRHFRSELEKREELWRLGGLERELVGAPGSQGGSGCYGLVNLV